MKDDYMKLAIELAKKAEEKDEVPVGCVIVDGNNNLVSYASNSIVKDYDPTAHAEIIAIRRACKKLKTTKLINFSIFVTLEPCIMCEAAIINVGIKKVFFGAYSDNLKLHNCKLKNYFSSRGDYQFFGGFEEECCAKLITQSFKKRR